MADQCGTASGRCPHCNPRAAEGGNRPRTGWLRAAWVSWSRRGSGKVCVMTQRPQGSARRGRPGHDQHDVLRVAVDLFNRQGYDATSVGDVARELGLTKSAIYHHVPSKEHLLHSAVAEALDALTEALDVVSATKGLDAGQRLRAAVRGSVTVLVGHLPAVTLLLPGPRQHPGREGCRGPTTCDRRTPGRHGQGGGGRGRAARRPRPARDQPADLRDGELADRVGASRRGCRDPGRHGREPGVRRA